MHLKIRNILLAAFLIAALILSSESEGFAMASKPSYTPGNQGGYQNGNNGGYNGENNGGGRKHHSAPEPSTLILIGTGLVGLWAFRKKLM